jgi:uncharacterized protein YqhQ
MWRLFTHPTTHPHPKKKEKEKEKKERKKQASWILNLICGIGHAFCLVRSPFGFTVLPIFLYTVFWLIKLVINVDNFLC